MHRFKLPVSAVIATLLFGSWSGAAFAKRRRAAKPAPDATPATEVDVDTSIAAPSSAPAVVAPAAEPAPDRKPALPAAPAVERPSRPAARSSVVAAAEPAEALTAGRAPERAAPRLSGHVGVASPLLTLRATRTERHLGSVNEDLTLVAPIGLGLELTDHWTFDFEFQISTGVRPEGLTTAIVDPGVLYAWNALAAGVRVGWQLNANQNIGLIPLARLAILRNERASWFVEASLPAFVRNKQLTASAALQTGVAF